MDENSIREELKKNPFSVLWELVYNYIYEEIVSGVLCPGDQLRESQIAEKLGISRSPVKKAIEMLTERGYLERNAGKTPTVRSLSYDEYVKLYEARYAVETRAAYIAAKMATKEELEKLSEIVKQIRKAADVFDRNEYNRWDALFHMTIIKSAKNVYIQRMYESILGDISRYRFHLTQMCYSKNENEYFLQNVGDVHEDILRAVKSRNAAWAEQEMANDINSMLGTIQRVMF